MTSHGHRAAPIVFDPDMQTAIDKTSESLARALLTFCDGNYEKAKDALLKVAGLYSQAVAGWPDGGRDA